MIITVKFQYNKCGLPYHLYLFKRLYRMVGWGEGGSWLKTWRSYCTRITNKTILIQSSLITNIKRSMLVYRHAHKPRPLERRMQRGLSESTEWYLKSSFTFSFPLLLYCCHFFPSSLYNSAYVFTCLSLLPICPWVATFVTSVFLDKSTCRYWFSSFFGGHHASVDVKFFSMLEAAISPSLNSPAWIPRGSKQPGEQYQY